MLWPSQDRTIQLLLKDPQSKWFDNPNTSAKETCADLVNQSFNAMVTELTKKLGQPGTAWEWGKVKITHIDHLASIPGFGAKQMIAGGTGSVVNAITATHGPSWRMVVQLGPKVQGYGVFPGGESGNPGSLYYDDMLKTWEAGELKPLLFLQSATEQSPRIKSTLTLNAY